MIPGNREADYEADVWTDHDEMHHGRITDLEETYPEGFVWDCCDQRGDEEGCETNVHRGAEPEMECAFATPVKAVAKPGTKPSLMLAADEDEETSDSEESW